MLECKEVRPLLADYEAGNLPAERVGQVADHLLLCPICAAALEDLRREKDRPAAAPSPAAPRSLGTQDPLAGKTPAAVAPEQTPAPAEETAEQESVAAQATQVAPARKLRLRTVVFLGLAVLLVLVGVCAGILYSRGFFDIRDWAKSEDGRFVAVVYEGTEDGEDGFRIRLWDTKEKGWYDELAFLDGDYHRMLWAPDGVRLAVEYRNSAGKDTAEVLLMTEEAVKNVSLYARMKSDLDRAGGYLGKTPLVDVPDCRILGWMPNCYILLLAAEGVVDTNIDPDFGVDYAGSGSTPIQPRAGTNNGQIATGCLAVDTNWFNLEVLYGFGISTGTQDSYQQSQLASRFSSHMMIPGSSFGKQNRQEFFDLEALLQLPQLVQDGIKIQLYYDLGDSMPAAQAFVPFEADLSLLTELESAQGILLVLCREQYLQDPVQEAYLILPYSGVVQ